MSDAAEVAAVALAEAGMWAEAALKFEEAEKQAPALAKLPEARAYCDFCIGCWSATAAASLHSART